LTVKNE